MKINEASKFVPNLLYRPDDQDYLHHQLPNPLKPIDNNLHQNSRKNNRKNKLPKQFIEDETENEQNIGVEVEEEVASESIKRCQEGLQVGQGLTLAAHRKKPNFLLQLEFEESSEDGEETQQAQNSQGKEEIKLPVFANIDKLQLVDWSNSSENNEEIPKELTQQIQQKKTKKAAMIITKTGIFDQIGGDAANGDTVQCLLRRDKNASGFTEYSIYVKDNLHHIVTVRKEGLWKYCLYFREKSDGEQFFKYTKIATLESSFLGNKFTLIKENEERSIVTICYQTNIFGLSGPRKFFIYLPKVELPFQYLHESYEDLKYRDKIQKFVSRTAKWNEKSKTYMLNFHGRASESSIKNFLVTDKEEHQEKDFIIFGKVSPDVYNLDIQSPFSLAQGIAVALTAFERKLTCD